jgi:hypothetical protein
MGIHLPSFHKAQRQDVIGVTFWRNSGAKVNLYRELSIIGAMAQGVKRRRA